MSLHPALAAVRRAVRGSLAGIAPGEVVIVACSGGADSLALLSAAVFEGHKLGLRIIGATVDHDLQDGSAEHAQHVVEQMAVIGVEETVSARVDVTGVGVGPEAAAREARYALLNELAHRYGAKVVLLGHTRDDQAETVLLGLARGSGGRSIAGMRRAFGVYRRPLLDVGRDDTVTACQVESLDYWSDPHNGNPAYSRVRVRMRVIPVLEEELGPGVTAALARTADQLRGDMEFLDALADDAYERLRGDDWDVAALADLATPLRRRVLRRAALAAGALASELGYEHVVALDSLVTEWHGQRWVDLPGHLKAWRRDDRLHLGPRVDPQ